MPIRLVSSSGVLGTVAVVSADASVDFDGTFANPQSYAGSIDASTEDASIVVFGVYESAPDRTGTLAALAGPATSDFVSFTTNVWGAVPTLTFNQGTSSSIDLTQYYTLPVGETFVSVTISGSLPTGVTLNGTSLDYNGTSPSASSSVVFELNTTANVSDFATRSAGSFYANNFDFANRAAYLQGCHNAKYGWTGASFGDDGKTDPIPSGQEKLTFDTVEKASGAGSSKHTLYPSEGASEAGPAYNISFDGIGATTKNTSKYDFYAQWRVKINQAFIDHNPSTPMTKMAIIYSPDRSFEQGEVVPGFVNGRQSVITGYRLTPSGTPGYKNNGYTHPGGVSNFVYTNFVNKGVYSGGTTFDEFQRQYGYTQYDFGGSGGVSQSDADIQHLPLLTDGSWSTIMVYIRTSTNPRIVKVWVANEDEEPILLYGCMDDEIPLAPKNDGAGTQIYSGIQFLMRPEDTSNAPAAPISMWIDEVICSDNPIQFPGGFDAPFLGTEVPILFGDTYPFNGSSEVL